MFRIYAVIDDNDVLWVHHDGELICTRIRQGNPHRCISMEDGIEWLKDNGYIKPDPLKKALQKLNKLVDEWEEEHVYGLGLEFHTGIKDAIRTLHKELTDE